jgi:hypothetical protein
MVGVEVRAAFGKAKTSLQVVLLKTRLLAEIVPEGGLHHHREPGHYSSARMSLKNAALR